MGNQARLVAVGNKVMLSLFGELYDFDEAATVIECNAEGAARVCVEGEIAFSRDADLAMMERAKST